MDGVYVLESRPLTGWGDYGDILLHGMTMHLPRAGAMLQLERTAPFVPPISVGLDVVVTEDTKNRLAASGLSGLGFRPVVKARIVHLPWETWDRTLPEPPLYPETGEPEDYILEREHDPSASNALGNLYEIVVSQSARVKRIEGPTALFEAIHLVPESWDGSDFFGAEGVLLKYVSARAKAWLETAFPEYVAFTVS
jgi:hypothetical protein